MRQPFVAPTRVVLALLALLSPRARAEAPPAQGSDFFEKEVRPLLVERCLECHGEKGKPKGGLRLTSREAVLKGGDSGPAAVAGKPSESLIVEAIRYVDEPKMPPKAKLKDREIAVLTRWVEQGLPWPEAHASPTSTPDPAGRYTIRDDQRRFWSFQPVRAVVPPAVRDRAWPSAPLDRFILAGLESKGLRPASWADRRTLIRRATFDLTGLPPTPEEVEAFLADQSPEAFARVVDRLLASPRYGERWGRHWLDIVRYTDSFDSRGVGSDGDVANAWRYRDWVVGALNRDLPYDEFLVNQVAGDLLPAKVPGDVNVEGTIATSLLAIGNWGGGDADKEKLLTDIADDQVDVVSRTFLGLTVACARCHDHKFDPIPTRDYYGLAGIFFSTHILPDVGPKTNGPPMIKVPVNSKAELAEREAHDRKVAELAGRVDRTIAEEKASLSRAMLPQTARYLVAAWDYQVLSSSFPSLAEFAEGRGLEEYALRQWMAEFGSSADYPLMKVAIRAVGDRPGIQGWKGEADCPSLVVNRTTEEAAIATFKLPPRAVAVHPGPKNGVAVTWRSPIAGKVRITGRLSDVDSVCGDGIAWALDHRSSFATRELVRGEIENGEARTVEGPGLAEVEVHVGDRIDLLVLPRKEYSCDTTVVGLTIADQTGRATWDLAGDLLDEPLQGNPHADRLGHADAWRFEDMADRPRNRSPEGAAGEALARWQREVAGPAPDRAAVEAAALAFQRSFDRADPASPFWIKSDSDLGALPAESQSRIARARDELDAARKEPVPPLVFANAAQEGGVPGSPHAGVHDVRVHIRGSYARLGELVPRHFPIILAGDSTPPSLTGSGRLELARWLASPENALTARVMVNRIWQHHFGAGIVRTPSNFGKLGERPSHPELLDYLARQFSEGGWSIKRMHREMMLSATYQQSSTPAAETGKADPDNRLFGRMGRPRLESEAIRDSLLAVAGQLDATLGGPSTRDFDTTRRTLYVMTIRSDRSGFGPLFDVADSTAMVDNRTVSTVSPQALFLLNHPFVLERARALARRVVASASDDAARIDRAYAILFGRPPTSEERQDGLSCLADAKGLAPEAAWESYCQVLLCTNELIFVD